MNQTQQMGIPSQDSWQPPLRLIGNKELDHAQEQRDEARLLAEQRQAKPFILSLAAHLQGLWENAKRAKDPIQTKILDDYRQRNGEYDPIKLAQIKTQGGSVIYMMLTNIKCRAAEAWIKDVMMPADDLAWKVEPTPIAELPEQIEDEIYQRAVAYAFQVAAMTGNPVNVDGISEQTEIVEKFAKEEIQFKAEEAAEGMQDKIEDQFAEGGWRAAFFEAVSDVATTKAGFIKGPVIRRKKTLKWAIVNGVHQPQSDTELKVEFERRSPLDIYPSPEASDIQDGYLFDRQKLTRGDLAAMIGVPGYDDKAIQAVLAQYATVGLRNPEPGDDQRNQVEGRQPMDPSQSETIEAKEFWGSVPGSLLLEWGIDREQIPDPDDEYQVNAWLVGEWVIKAVVNEHPLGIRPYSKACFESIPGAFWGRGIPELMRDCQEICNAAVRALVNNLAISSGPQVVVHDVNRIPEGEDLSAMYPWKIWKFDPGQHLGEAPMSFFQPNSMTAELLKVYEKFSKVADEVTGIPAYSHGDPDTSGAGNTASGFSMLLGQAARGIKSVVANIDDGMIEPTVKRSYIHNMLYEDDETIKGDLNVIARGTAALIQKEHQQVRRTEFLQATANPVDLQITGIQGRAALLREQAKTLDLPVDEIIPENVMANAQQPQAMAPTQQTGLPVEEPTQLDPAGNPVSGQDHALF